MKNLYKTDNVKSVNIINGSHTKNLYNGTIICLTFFLFIILCNYYMVT